MSDEQEAGFKIGDDFYPYVFNHTMGDAILVNKLTDGMGIGEFGQKLLEGTTDPGVIAAMVGISYWRKHPSLRVGEVLTFVNQLDIDQFEPVAPQEEGDPLPPAHGPTTRPDTQDSSGSPNGSSSTPASGSESPIPSLSGAPS